MTLLKSEADAVKCLLALVISLGEKHTHALGSFPRPNLDGRKAECLRDQSALSLYDYRNHILLQSYLLADYAVQARGLLISEI